MVNRDHEPEVSSSFGHRLLNALLRSRERVDPRYGAERRTWWAPCGSGAVEKGRVVCPMLAAPAAIEPSGDIVLTNCQ